MSTNRLESFSDGVIAVAITLLVLNFVLPSGRNLGHQLENEWPVYAAYATSFLTIGIIWINHHLTIGRLARADHSILTLNLVLLMTVVVIPFGTHLLSSYLRSSHDEHLAAGVYGGILFAMAVTFTALNWQILMRRPQLLSQPLSLDERRAIFRRQASGVFPYALAAGLAVLSPYITLAASFALAAFYALPIAGLTQPDPGARD
jgi:uncharacterized membrane protein